MFGLFGKKNDRDNREEQTRQGAQRSQQPAQSQQPLQAQHGGDSARKLSYTATDNGAGQLTTYNGKLVHALAAPATANMENFRYAKQILPGVFRYLATFDSDNYSLLQDQQLPEGLDIDEPIMSAATFPGMDLPQSTPTFWDTAVLATEYKSVEKLRMGRSEDQAFFKAESEFPFATTMALNFPRFLQITKIPDYGHGHVVSLPVGNVILIYPVQAHHSADYVVNQYKMTAYEARKQAVTISPLDFWVRGNHWEVLATPDGKGLYIPQEFPVQRNAEGAPVTSAGEAGIQT